MSMQIVWRTFLMDHPTFSSRLIEKESEREFSSTVQTKNVSLSNVCNGDCF